MPALHAGRRQVNIHFIAVLLAILLMVTYIPGTGVGLVEFFYR